MSATRWRPTARARTARRSEAPRSRRPTNRAATGRDSTHSHRSACSAFRRMCQARTTILRATGFRLPNTAASVARMLIIDAPANWTADTALAGLAAFGAAAAIMRRSISRGSWRRTRSMAASTRRSRPAARSRASFAGPIASAAFGLRRPGLNAPLRGIWDLSIKLSDVQTGVLAAGGVNCLRALPTGWYVWGARTLAGADTEASRWKYIPVRRLVSYIVRSMDEGTQWAVFEPNSERLWARVVQSASLFFWQLWRQGALAGNKPEDRHSTCAATEPPCHQTIS